MEVYEKYKYGKNWSKYVLLYYRVQEIWSFVIYFSFTS